MNWAFESKTFDTFYALDSFVQYWAENEKLIENAADEEVERSGPKWEPKDEDQLGEYFMERDMARYLHDKILIPMLRYSCIVMLYTTAERELRRLIENLQEQHGPQKLKVSDIRESAFLTQAAKFIEVFFSLRLAACPQFQALCDLQKIRDCIVHCRGEVALSRDKSYLVSLNDRRPGFFAWEGTDIKIEAECVEQFMRESWHFFVWVFGELKWKIDETWMKKKWVQSSPSGKS
jgi:hypothetical protein